MGILLYRMLCGRRPFEAETTEALIDQQLYSRPRLLDAQVPDIPVYDMSAEVQQDFANIAADDEEYYPEPEHQVDDPQNDGEGNDAQLDFLSQTQRIEQQELEASEAPEQLEAETQTSSSSTHIGAPGRLILRALDHLTAQLSNPHPQGDEAQEELERLFL